MPPRLSPCSLNFWVVKRVTWLNSLQNDNFSYKMLTCNLFMTSKNELSNSRNKSPAKRPGSLLKALFNGALFLIYYFKKHFQLCFSILKALKDILQHFKFVNWWIRAFVFFWCHEQVKRSYTGWFNPKCSLLQFSHVLS